MTSVARRYSSGSISSKKEKTVVIASFTQTSIGPSSASIRSAAASTADASETSVGIASAVPPAASTSPRTPSSASSPRESSATLARSLPKRRAIALPIPDPAPVTTTTLSSKFAMTAHYPAR